MLEAQVQQRVRLEAARFGLQLWRNNSGAFTDERGRLVRFGLGNDSAALSAQIKSSDLIGITPVTVTQAHVGRILGVFTALECKRPGWHLTPGDERAIAQGRFHGIVRDAGGFAGFVCDPADIWKVLV